MAALLAVDQLPAPPPLRKTLHTSDIHLTETTDQARLLPKQPEKLKTTVEVLATEDR